MRRIDLSDLASRLSLLTLTLTLCLASSAPQAALAQNALLNKYLGFCALSITGYWQGSVTAGTVTVPVALSISNDGRATLDSPPLGFLDEALKVISSTPEHLRFELRSIARL